MSKDFCSRNHAGIIYIPFAPLSSLCSFLFLPVFVSPLFPSPLNSPMRSILAAAATAVLFSLLSVVIAQDGTGNIPASYNGTSPYVCDPKVCIYPTCVCASLNPPNGMVASTVPQFVTITFDDDVGPELIATAYKVLAAASNPNGCPARGTWFVSIQWSEFDLVQEWYSAGNEVADHTWTHVGTPPAIEIESCKASLNAYAGIPRGKIQGFRAPFLNYTAGTFQEIGQQGFLYDSSATAVIDDANWPYTLDYGLANDCWSGICAPGTIKQPGVWEIPMHAIVDNTGIPQLMDVYLAGTVADVTSWYNTNWARHYNGQRAPFGIYVHPTHLTNYVGLPDETANLNGLLAIIKTIASQPDVWFVTNQQLLQWMKNPVPASEMAAQSYMKCQQPVINRTICNGLDDTGAGINYPNLTLSCGIGNTYFDTCFNCPGTEPTVNNPVPAPALQPGQTALRSLIPDTCDTPWWDPIGNTCLCNSSACAYKDLSQPIVLTNTTSNGTSANGSSTGTPTGTSTNKSGASHTVLNTVGMLVIAMLSAGIMVSV